MQVSTSPFMTGELSPAYSSKSFWRTRQHPVVSQFALYALQSGALPTGTSLNTSTGVVSGTTSAAATFSFTIKVTDSLGNVGTQAFSITVSAPAASDGAFTFLN